MEKLELSLQPSLGRLHPTNGRHLLRPAQAALNATNWRDAALAVAEAWKPTALEYWYSTEPFSLQNDSHAFLIIGQRYPLVPKNGFYDWLYIRALAKHVDWINENVSYDAYTDIEFNPETQVNCQARAFAEYKSLAAKSELDAAVRDFRHFASMLSPI